MNLSRIDRKLFDLLQVKFPLTKHPYADIGLSLGINEEEVIAQIKQLKARGIIRQISPVLDTRRLGYESTLVAMRVAETQLDKAVELLTKHPGVSHAYERDHYLNLWFTLASPSKASIENELSQLTGSIGAEVAFNLPAVKLFKISAYFAMGGDGQSIDDGMQPDGGLTQGVKRSRWDRLVINELQQDLPLIPSPFTTMAEQLGMGEGHFLAQCQSFLRRGIMRRYGASVNHRKVGFEANAMTCWAASPEKVYDAGQKLASLREVSHCYERKTNPLWRHNLFAVIHGHTRETCQQIAGSVSAETGLTDCVILFSTRELKKTRIKYLV